MPVLGNPGDSLEAAQRCADLGIGALVTLGGDGTNRVVAKGCGDVPLMPISTGTNNVFPRMVEGTLAGVATALVATSVTPDAIERQPKLEIAVDGDDGASGPDELVDDVQPGGAGAHGELGAAQVLRLDRQDPLGDGHRARGGRPGQQLRGQPVG